MYKQLILTILSVIFLTTASYGQKLKGKHSFALGTTEFLLDGDPFQIISGKYIRREYPPNTGATGSRWPKPWVAIQ
jgi:hypothetical protein